MKRWLPFEAIAALRFLREGRMQTGFILAGVTIGVAVIVFLSGLLAGLQANFIRRVLTSQAQIVLLPPEEVARPQRADGPDLVADPLVQRPAQRLRSIDQWQAILGTLRGMPEIGVAAPVASGSALALRGEASRSVGVIGVEPDPWFQVVHLPANMAAGTPRLTSQDVVIGTELGRLIGLEVGARIRLSAANGRDAVLTVTGLFDFGNKAVNERNVYVALRTAQSLLGLEGGVTSLELTVKDVWAAERVAQAIHRMTGVRADSWIATNIQFFTAVNAQQMTNTLIRIFVGISVALGIASVLVVSVVQRSREIGILRAMGARRGQVLRIFLIQGGVLGLLGSLSGSAVGAGTVIAWHGLARQADGSELFPLVLGPVLFVAASLLAMLTGVLAAVAPAVRAARLDPVVAIRG
ncbi:ABC transporter permease [Paracraurococcus lichenis]|uniref:ABC transporter permease n=1 Tax=Paracraurococcus lichenis TaxID=3064888 RepID=A0ABT9DW55_9PROT|nr:FtsX-like permease family protein [Paracraurococcus sp. LOR1-02]MDO9708122.1 ABC transporter permease [Paracraurococcus sp. LOR1-02]